MKNSNLEKKIEKHFFENHKCYQEKIKRLIDPLNARNK